MTNGIELKPGHKFINPEYPDEGQVPESVTFGKDFAGAGSAIIAVGCKFGDNVRLGYGPMTIGEHVIVGNSVNVKADTIGVRVTIGNNCDIGHHAILEDNVQIGNNVIIGPNVKLKEGVVVPSNWEIPYGCIVNPGLYGLPVVISPQPQFRCNVTAANRW